MDVSSFKIKRIISQGQIRYPVVPKQALEYRDPKDLTPKELPIGRVSVENSNSYMSTVRELLGEFNGVDAKYPIQWLELMENLSLINPNVSQMVDNVVRLGNTGHKIVIETDSEGERERMTEELNLWSQRAFKDFGGIDGYINTLLGQMVRAGAISTEWIPDLNLEGIQKVVFVPVKEIRFFLDKEGNYRPFQKINDINKGKQGLIELNTSTYQYCAIDKLDNSPYGIPPILAALESLQIERDIIKNFKFVAKKMGLLGFVNFLLTAPARAGGESDDSYLARCRAFLESQAGVIKDNYRDGIALGFKGSLEVEHHSLMGSAQGAKEIYQAIEENVFSGIKADPAMHGRTYSTTETYAGVVYEKMLSQLNNYQRILRINIEYGAKLHLLLKGYSFLNLYAEFETARSIRQERDEDAYNKKLQNLEWLYNQGIISQEQKAQEAGYDTPDLPEPRSNANGNTPQEEEEDQKSQSRGVFTYTFSKANGRYTTTSKIQKKPTQLQIALETKEVEQLEEDFDLDLDNQIDMLLEEEFSEFYLKLLDDYSCSCGDTHSLAAGDEVLKKFFKEYFKKVYPSIKGARLKAVREAVDEVLKMDLNDIDSKAFAEQIISKMEKVFGISVKTSPLDNNIRTELNKMYKFFRGVDATPYDGKKVPPAVKKFDLVDKQAVNFARKADSFYFGRYVTNPETKAQLRAWLEKDFLKSGKSLRDRGELQKFRQRFGDRVGREDYKVLRVVNTSVSRMKNWGNALSVNKAGAKTIKITGPRDQITCGWCSAMIIKDQPRFFEVKDVVKHVKYVMSQEPEALPKLSPFLTSKFQPEQIKDLSSETLLEAGIALPPYHPNCRHTFIVTTFR